MTSEFHDNEISSFITECTKEKLTEKSLLIRFKEDITVQNISSCTNSTRRKLRDYLEDNSVPCGKGSGESIQYSLILLLQPTQEKTSYPREELRIIITQHLLKEIF